MTNPHPRPYDVAMSPDFLRSVRARRSSPDGERREVVYTLRNGRRIAKYPWNAMLLGDYFFVPVLNRHRDRLDVRFRQAAARRDWELTVVSWALDGVPHLRVCLTCVDVAAIKRKAKTYHNKKIVISDGRWAERRKRSERVKRDDLASRVTGPTLDQRLSSTPSLPPPRHGEDSLQPLPIDAAISVAPADLTISPGYDRAAVLRDRLAKMGVKT